MKGSPTSWNHLDGNLPICACGGNVHSLERRILVVCGAGRAFPSWGSGCCLLVLNQDGKNDLGRWLTGLLGRGLGGRNDLSRPFSTFKNLGLAFGHPRTKSYLPLYVLSVRWKKEGATLRWSVVG